MKKLTNYAPGPRGVMLKSGEVVWIDPGKSATVDPAKIVEPLPDLGTKPAAVDPDEAERVEALTAENAELRAQVEAQAGEITALKADLEKATKPAK